MPLSITREKNYFYVVNYSKEERALCLLEIKSLFDQEPTEKYFYSPRNIDPSRSPFIKLRIAVLSTASSFEELLQLVGERKITCGNFKFARFKIKEGKLDYETWLHSVTELGKVIQAEVDMKNPTIQFGITILKSVQFYSYDYNKPFK